MASALKPPHTESAMLLAKPVLPLLRRLFPRYVLTTEEIGRAMIHVARQGAPKKILEIGIFKECARFAVIRQLSPDSRKVEQNVKHIGIVGCSFEGAALCYRTICLEAEALMGKHTHPEITLHTISLAKYMEYLPDGNWNGVADLILRSAQALQRAGADFLICPDNTIHQALPFVQPVFSAAVASHCRRGGQRSEETRPPMPRAHWNEISSSRPRVSGKARRPGHPLHETHRSHNRNGSTKLFLMSWSAASKNRNHLRYFQQVIRRIQDPQLRRGDSRLHGNSPARP